MDLAAFLDRLDAVRQRGDQYTARCPAHEDRQASLSVTQQGDRILLHCFAGCEPEAITGALGLTLKDLSPPARGKERPPSARGKLLHTYDYHDAGGRLLFQVCRFTPKSFRQRRPDGRGGWVWNLQGIDPVLYHLPQVLAAARAGETVYLVEGEKDADNLVALGLTATTCPMGAGKFRPSYAAALAGAHLVLLPDNDGPGADHARDFARGCVDAAASVRIVTLPDLGPKEDVSDWLKRGGNREQLERLAAGTPLWERPEEPEAAEDPGAFRMTDVGNARRLVGRHGSDLRYLHASNDWLIWRGTCWRRDEDGEIIRRATDTISAIHEEIEACPDADRKGALVRHQLASEGGKRIENMIKLARSEPGIPIQVRDLDRDHWLLPCANGTVDLRTGTLRAHRREDLITRTLSLPYDPLARCPLWTRFVEQVMDRNQELVRFLQRSVGYALTGSCREQVFWLHWGRGSNGKSTFLGLLRTLLGPLALSTSFETFIESAGGRVRDDLADLPGIRLVTAVETGEGRRLDEATIKWVTGGDEIRTRHLYGRYFTFTPEFKIHLAANHRPTVRGSDRGIWRRVLLVPWTVELKDDEKDPELPQKLRGELAGILAWAVRGCSDWLKHGLQTPPAVVAATEDYRGEMDTVGQFLDERCTRIVPGARTAASLLYGAYKHYAERAGERPLSMKAFNLRVREKGIESLKSVGVTTWLGLGLLAQPDGEQGVGDERRPFSNLSHAQHGKVSGFELPSSPEPEDPSLFGREPSLEDEAEGRSWYR